MHYEYFYIAHIVGGAYRRVKVEGFVVTHGCMIMFERQYQSARFTSSANVLEIPYKLILHV